MFEPAEKSCWRTLLSEQPEVSPSSTGMWTLAIEETLHQLWTILHEKSVERGLHAARLKPMQLGSATTCALDGLLPFFHAGQRSLNLIADEIETTVPDATRPEARVAMEELRAAFDLLVQWQLQSGCAHCAHALECWRSGARNLGCGSQPAQETLAADERKKKRRPAPSRRR